MTIRNILVAFNGTELSRQALRLAVRIAQLRDAHLTAVFAHAMPYHYLQMDAYVPADVAAGLEEYESRHEEEVEADFKAVIAAESMLERYDYHAIRGYPSDVIAEFARTFDITVVAQPPEEHSDSYNEAQADTVALRSGRPVLVAPRHWDGKWGETGALLAWDGQRAAARALADSMDMLERRHDLTVLHVGEEDDVRRPGRDIMTHLSRHGLAATLRVEKRSSISITDMVLNACVEEGAGLLVMGAYEHSAFSEMLLGGVTRDVLRQCHIPILLSH